MVVIRLPHGLSFFVVFWCCVGCWVQQMETSEGRRRVSRESLEFEILIHAVQVPAADWLEWVTSEDTLAVFFSRLCSLGASAEHASHILQQQQTKQSWQAMAQLDAALRMLRSLVDAGGLKRGGAIL